MSDPTALLISLLAWELGVWAASGEHDCFDECFASATRLLMAWFLSTFPVFRALMLALGLLSQAGVWAPGPDVTCRWTTVARCLERCIGGSAR